MVSRAAVLGVLFLLLLGGSLSGCLGNEDGKKVAAALPTDGTVEAEDPLVARWGDSPPSVFGFITDVSRNPLPGAVVTAQSLDEPFTAESDGYYEFRGLEAEKAHVLVAALDGFVTQSLRIVTHLDQIKQLDFMLQETPKEVPRVVPIEKVALLGCEVRAVAGAEHGKEGNEVYQKCDSENADSVTVLDFQVDPKVAGIVIELKWSYATPLAEFMLARAETKGYGDLDTELGEAIGPTVLKIEVAQENVEKYYNGAGGQFTLTLETHPAEDDEQALGAAFAYNQRVDVLVTVFYVEPNPPGYSGITAA